MKVFVSGKPGCGKSTLVREVVEELKGRMKIAGILTPEFREQGVRKGFKIVDLASGKELVMAAVGIQGPRVSKYGVSVENINKILDEFLGGFDGAELIVLDELGPMEFKSKEFRDVLERVLGSGKHVLAALHRSLVTRFETQGKVLWFEDNAEELKCKILDMVK